MRLLLIWPNSRNKLLNGSNLGEISEPLALEYLAADAKLDGHTAKILDMRWHPDGLDTAVELFRPDVVGVTGYSMHVWLCQRTMGLSRTSGAHY